MTRPRVKVKWRRRQRCGGSNPNVPHSSPIKWRSAVHFNSTSFGSARKTPTQCSRCIAMPRPTGGWSAGSLWNHGPAMNTLKLRARKRRIGQKGGEVARPAADKKGLQFLQPLHRREQGCANREKNRRPAKAQPSLGRPSILANCAEGGALSLCRSGPSPR